MLEDMPPYTYVVFVCGSIKKTSKIYKLLSSKCTTCVFEKQKPQGYNYLSIAKDTQQKRYIETFFYSQTDNYLRNQKIIKVKKVEIYDNYGKLFLEDYL